MRPECGDCLFCLTWPASASWTLAENKMSCSEEGMQPITPIFVHPGKPYGHFGHAFDGAHIWHFDSPCGHVL